MGLLARLTDATSDSLTATAADASSPEAGVKSWASVPESVQGGAEIAASSIADVSTVRGG